MPAKRPRWSQDQLAEINRLTRKMNDKVRREMRKNPENIAALERLKLSARAIKAEGGGKASLTKLQNQVARAFKRDAFDVRTNPYGITATKYELSEMKRQAGIITRARKAAAKQLATPSPYRGTMGKAADYELQPKEVRFEKVRSTKALEKLKESIQVQAKPGARKASNEEYKNSYLRAIRENLGSAGSDLHRLVSGTPASRVVAGSYYDSALDIRSMYPSGASAKALANHIESIWREFLGQPEEERQDEMILPDEIELADIELPFESEELGDIELPFDWEELGDE